MNSNEYLKHHSVKGERINEYVNDNYLAHYGVLGMKWGIRRGNVGKAYSKAVAKRDKLNQKVELARKDYTKAQIKNSSRVVKKYQSLQAEADKLQRKADKKKYGFFSNPNKAAKLQVKADRAQYKANKYKSRAEKRALNETEAKGKYARAQRKAEKWVKAMDRTFTNQIMSQIDAGSINKGAEYVKQKIA